MRDAVDVVPYKHEPRKKIKHSVFSRKEDGERFVLHPSPLGKSAQQSRRAGGIFLLQNGRMYDIL